MWQTDSQMEKMRATINARDRQKTIEETDMEVKGEDPAITTITAPTAKVATGYKDNSYQGNNRKSSGYRSYGKEDYKNFHQGNPESTTHHQKICSTDHVIFTLRLSMENEYPDTQ
jgi:hypothetical protein